MRSDFVYNGTVVDTPFPVFIQTLHPCSSSGEKHRRGTKNREHGVSIVYTHFGKGFYENGQLKATFRERLRDLASRDGWFVPASELLDYLRRRRGEETELSLGEKLRLKVTWLWEKALHGRS